MSKLNDELTLEQQRVHHKLLTDFSFYAPRCLKIVDKEGKVLPFSFNSAQDYLHAEIERMKAEVGFVRIIVVKGRQQGISTYIEGRFYWLSSLQRAKTVCILSHEAKSTAALFDKVDFYYNNCPVQMRPERLASNRHELKFDNDSKYLVATAGSENSGRSQTAQYLHASEVGFFTCTDELAAGIFQIVADLPGTEIIKESTGNGMNGFYTDVMEALAGRGGYRVVFIPWYWQTEYRAPVAPDFKPDQEELNLIALYGLDHQQLQWRRNKIVQLKSLRLFKQEYPNTLMEAFQSSGASFFDPELVQKARRTRIKSPLGALILGVDPARKGDRTILTLRRGRKVLDIEKYDEMDEMRLAGIIANKIDKLGIDKVFIDYAMGHGTVDRLRERGYGRIVEGVNFGGAADDPRYLNKRAEMMFNLRDWLADGDVELPDDDDMAADIALLPDFVQNSRGSLHFPPKDKLREKFGRSPDILDSLALTFAYPVVERDGLSRGPGRTKNTTGGSQLNTLRRIRKADPDRALDGEVSRSIRRSRFN